MVTTLSTLLRFCSVLFCLIVLVWFGVFAIDQTRTAAGHQREQVSSPMGATSTPVANVHEGPVRRALDDAGSGLTSPFSGVVAQNSSEWLERGVRVLLALLVYGFGLGYLARVLRVRI